MPNNNVGLAKQIVIKLILTTLWLFTELGLKLDPRTAMEDSDTRFGEASKNTFKAGSITEQAGSITINWLKPSFKGRESPWANKVVAKR